MNKKTIGWIVGILIVCVIGYFIYDSQQPKTYDDFYALGTQKIEEKDYEKAKEYLLKAKELDDKQLEVYSQLFILYNLEMNEKEMANILKMIEDAFDDESYDQCILLMRTYSESVSLSENKIPQTKAEIKAEEERIRQEEEEKKRKEEKEAKKKAEEEKKKKEEEEAAAIAAANAPTVLYYDGRYPVYFYPDGSMDTSSVPYDMYNACYHWIRELRGEFDRPDY